MIPLLSDTLLELATAVLPESGLLRVNRVHLDLPLEVALEESGGELQFCAVPPRWRWSTIFDSRPARIQLELCPEVIHEQRK